MSFVPIHKHLLIRATVLRFPTDPDEMNKHLRELVRLVDMSPVTHPQSVYVAEPGNEGLTGSINLATSHIAYHHWENNKLLMLDLYSCKCFNEDIVIRYLDDNFNLSSIRYKIIDREFD